MLFSIYNRVYNYLYHVKGILSFYSFFRSTIPDYYSKKLLNKRGYKDLDLFSKVLMQNDIAFFCDFGTLLGIIRDNAFISHDTDIDIGILYNDCFSWNKIESVLSANRIRKMHDYYYNGEIVEQTYSFSDGLKIDLFLYKPYSDNMMRTQVFFKDHSIIYPNAKARSVKALDYPIIKTIKPYRFNGCETMIPDEPVKHLLAVYGIDWKVPDPNYKPDRKDNILEGFGFKE